MTDASTLERTVAAARGVDISEQLMPAHVPSKEHLKGYGPIYALLVVLGGGGGAAAITDNIPVTNGQFIAWTDTHSSSMHTQSSEAIDDINGALVVIQLEQTRDSLKVAYADKCRARGAVLEYIDREIARLEVLYKKLTNLEYDPQPCAV